MGIKRFISEVIRKITRKKEDLKTNMDMLDDQIDHRQEELEEKYGDPEEMDFSDLMDQAGDSDDE